MSLEDITVTVLIPAYNEQEHISETIQNIKEQSYKNIIQILVADDASTDNTGKIARECGVEVIRTPKNSGTKAQAQNFVLPYLRGELTVTIDADTTLDPKAVEDMVKKFVEERDIVSVCGFVIPERRKNIWELGRTIQYLYGLFMRKKTQEYLGIPIVCSGCFSMFDTKVLQKYGFKDRTMVEDMDLTWQFLTEGKKVRFLSDVVCFPKDPYNWKTYRGQVSRWLRGFFQCMSIYKKDIWKNKKLAIFLYWYMFEGLIGIVFYVLLIWSIVYPPPQYLVITAPINLVIPLKIIMPMMFLFSIAIVTICSLYQGTKLKIRKLEVLKGIPAYFALIMLDCFMFFEAFVNEWILKRRLEKWEKGH